MSHLAKETKTGGYLFDVDPDVDFDSRQPTSPEEIQKNAHVVNGGEAQFQCPSCKGSGVFRSYTGRTVGNCFKCKGTKFISKGQAAAAKGKATKLANQQAWHEEHRDLIAGLQDIAEWNNFARDTLDRLAQYGTLHDWVVEKAEKMLVTIAEKREAKRVEREAARPTIDNISAVEALFDQAKVKIAKTAIFRTVDITISRAKATGRNPGALYVKSTEGGEYLGKIVGGKFTKAYGVTDATEALQRVAADPTAEAIKYGRKFKSCCCCGKTLFAPVSVGAVVGPVCAPKWGLDYLRMEAAEMLAAEAEAEEQEKLR